MDVARTDRQTDRQADQQTDIIPEPHLALQAVQSDHWDQVGVSDTTATRLLATCINQLINQSNDPSVKQATNQ